MAVTDANGDPYRQYVYDPYGNIISVKDGSGTPVDINNDTGTANGDNGFNNAYTYRGYRFDSESGLYFLQSRYYAAGIGRFLTKDSVLGHTGDTQTLNRYAYCSDDPVNHVDPNGTSWLSFFKDVAKAAIGFISVVFGIGLEAPPALEAGAQDLAEVEADVSEAIGPAVENASRLAGKQVSQAIGIEELQ